MSHFRRKLSTIGFSAIFALALLADSGISLPNPKYPLDLNKVTFLPPPSTPPVVLVEDGKPKARIIVSNTSSAQIAATLREAAAELRKFIERSTGAALEIIPESRYDGKGPAIILGMGELTRSKGVVVGKLPAEGFKILTSNDCVVIAGRDTGLLPEKGYVYSHYGEQGTLWGVYEFLERFVGVRWYWPGKLGASVPRMKNLKIPPVSLWDAPTFQRREYYPAAGKEDAAFLRRSRMGRSTRMRTICHTPKNWDKVYSRTHPEYFALKDGKRNFGMKCYSNPGTFKQFMSDLRQFYTTGNSPAWGNWHLPDEYMIPLSPMDAYIDCECQRCVKARGTGSSPASNIWGAFIAKIANAIKKEWPEKELVILPYSNYLLPPDNIKFPDNVRAIYCNTRALANYKEPTLREYDQSAMEKWSAFLGRRKIGTWQYPCWPDHCTKATFLYPHLVKSFFTKNKDLVDGAFLNGADPDEWPHQHLVIFPWMKVMWHPNYDVDAAYDEYCRRMFGSAAPKMRQILRILSERWENVKWKNPPKYHNISPSQIYDETYPPNIVRKIKKLFAESLKVAANDPKTLKRLAFVGKALHPFFMESDRFHSLSTVAMPVLNIQKVAKNPVVDGNFDDACWNDAPKVNLVNALDKQKQTPDHPTTVQAVWSDNALTFAFTMSENAPEALLKVHHARDSNVWEDDSLEIFIDPFAKRQSYMQFVINSAGTVFDSLCRQLDDRSYVPEWNCEGITVKCSVGKNSWTAEVSIPYAGLNVNAPRTGDVWYGNLVRTKLTKPISLQRFSTTYAKKNNDIFAFSIFKFIGGREFTPDKHTKLLYHMNKLDSYGNLLENGGSDISLRLKKAFLTDNGRFGKGLELFGKGAAFSKVTFSNATNWTLECWVKWNGPTDDDQFIFYNGSQGVNGYGIFISHENNNQLAVRMGGRNVFFSKTSLQPNAWSHVALCNDKEKTVLFIDGKNALEIKDVIPRPPKGWYFALSMDMSSTSKAFNGVIDEVRLSDISRYDSK